MSKRNVIALTLDRLGAGYLGPYGNTWIETPSFNRLAAEGCVVETLMVDAPDPLTVLASVWSGLHDLCRRHNPGGVPAGGPGGQESHLPLLKTLAQSQIATVLLTDDPQLVRSPLVEGFERRFLVDLSPAQRLAETVEQTQMAQLFAESMECIASLDPGFFLWVHSRGMAECWDAPAEFREQFAEGDDPLPGDFTAPPSLMFPPGYDPDLALPLVHAFGGQVALCDLCVGALLETIDRRPDAQDTLLLLTAPRGFPLGEHLAVGDAAEDLYGELLHAPLIVRIADPAVAMRRHQVIAQPHDLFATFLDWLDTTSTPTRSLTRLGTPTRPQSISLLPLFYGSASDEIRRFAVSAWGGQIAIRTPGWHLRLPSEADDSPPQAELFVKPDDSWEMNNVADRCPQVVEAFLENKEALLQEVRGYGANGGAKIQLPDLLMESS